MTRRGPSRVDRQNRSWTIYAGVASSRRDWPQRFSARACHHAVPPHAALVLKLCLARFALTQALKAALEHKDSDAHIFFAPEGMRAGGFWKPQLAKEIEKSTAFILLVGEKGLGDWQVMEYYEALDRRAKKPAIRSF
jgi:hypothetical protein